IYPTLDSTSEYYGKLLNWCGQDGFWHYGIGLSDTKIFDTGRGKTIFDRDCVDAKLVLGIEDIVFPPQATIERLSYARECFQHWDYGLLGWNCEHLARLVATNVPISYEVRKTFLRYFNHDGYHPTAQHDFEQYLKIHAPHLLIRKRDI
ncbi:MAG: hypothetical protein SAJ12_23940, partial [Jaaginema sp. PMC 1079.18]|nr:hypothetical protein [Jaaginema sp. PMC 1079.18]